MIDLNTFQIFADHPSNLRRLSLDDGKGQKIYMTQSTRDAVNFDAVKKEYIKALRLSKVPSSNDALFDDGSGSLVFVEFKNGFISNKKKLEIWKKLYDSTLIFADITSTGISYTRNHMKYILVYNETVNQENESRQNSRKNERRQFNHLLHSMLLLRMWESMQMKNMCVLGLKYFKIIASRKYTHTPKLNLMLTCHHYDYTTR